MHTELFDQTVSDTNTMLEGSPSTWMQWKKKQMDPFFIETGSNALFLFCPQFTSVRFTNANSWYCYCSVYFGFKYLIPFIKPVLAHNTVLMTDTASFGKRSFKDSIICFLPDNWGFNATLFSIWHRLPGHGFSGRHLLLLQALKIVGWWPFLFTHKEKV